MTSRLRFVGGALLGAAIWSLSATQGFAVALSPVVQCDAFVRQLYNACVRTPTAVPDPRTKAQFCTDGLGAGMARCAAVYGKGMPPMMPKAPMKKH